jgi:hypothetical protein
MRRVTVILLIVLSLGFSGYAQTDIIGLHSNSNGIGCTITGGAGDVVRIYVFHSYSAGVTSSSFSIPIPSCMDGATHIADVVQFPSYSGDSQNGITIDYGGCRSGSFYVMRVSYMLGSEAESCCHIVPLAHPAAASGKIEAVDCSGTSFPIAGGPVVVNPELYCSDCGPDMILPYVLDPSPPDSAESTPLNPILSWGTYDPQHASSAYQVYFGASPDPPMVVDYHSEDSYDAGGLQANTTYYWKVGVWWGASVHLGPVWQFTTFDPTAVRQSTWGAIKALYQ